MLYTAPTLSHIKHVIHGWCGVPPQSPKHFESAEAAQAHRSINMSYALTALHMEASPPILLDQTHGTHVQIVDDTFLKTYTSEKPPKGDGLVTRAPYISIGIRTADCGPVLWAEPKAGIVAACHAGWRGALDGILEETFQTICRLGGDPQNIIAVLGPTISGKNYQINDDFRKTCLRKEPCSVDFFTKHMGDLFFDLPRFIEHKIRQMDISSVEVLHQDTFAGPLYSRRSSLSQEKYYGSNYAFVMLSPKNAEE